MSTEKYAKRRKIIWAIDPFEEHVQCRSELLATLQELSQLNARIEPVYVLSPDEYDINVQFNAPWLKRIRPTAEKVLEHFLRDVKVEGLSKPQVIIEKRPSLTRAIGALTAYAERTKADTILVGTHAKKGLSRFFLGSFAETLLLHSSIPVLVVGPRAEAAGKIKRTSRILFSTDFGPTSDSTFKKVLTLAKTHQAKIILLHCLRHPVEPILQSGVYLLGGSFISFPEFMTLDEERKQKLAAQYAAIAKKEGISVDVRIHSGRGNTAQAIVDQAQYEKADLIAMAAQSGSVVAALIGSVTRQVVRSAPCPVWILRAPVARKKVR